jgi:hypothetical protein
MEDEAAEDVHYELLLVSAAEAREIKEQQESQQAANFALPAAQWNKVYMRLLRAHRAANPLEAWRAASTADSYEQALARLTKIRSSEAASATEAGTLQQSAAWTEVIHSPDLFSVLLGLMDAATLGAAEAVCRTWQRRVAANREWERRVELLPRGYHGAPAELRQWRAWEGEELTTMGQVSAKEALMALTALAKPVRPRHPDVIAPQDLAFAVSITVESPQTPGVQPPKSRWTRIRPDAVAVDRNDPRTYHTTLVCAQVLPFAEAVPMHDDVAEGWVGHQALGVEEQAGLSWPCDVDTAKLLRCSEQEVQQMDGAALRRAISRVYHAEYDYESVPGKTGCGYARGSGCKSGASVSISVSAVRRTDKKVLPLVERAPLVLGYGSETHSNNYFEFEDQNALCKYISRPGDCDVEDHGDHGRYFDFLEPYGPRDFPMHDLIVRTSLSPVGGPDPGEWRWQLNLELCLASHKEPCAPPEHVRRMLSLAYWQG